MLITFSLVNSMFHPLFRNGKSIRIVSILSIHIWLQYADSNCFSYSYVFFIAIFDHLVDVIAKLQASILKYPNFLKLNKSLISYFIFLRECNKTSHYSNKNETISIKS